MPLIYTIEGVRVPERQARRAQAAGVVVRCTRVPDNHKPKVKGDRQLPEYVFDQIKEREELDRK